MLSAKKSGIKLPSLRAMISISRNGNNYKRTNKRKLMRLSRLLRRKFKRRKSCRLRDSQLGNDVIFIILFVRTKDMDETSMRKSRRKSAPGLPKKSKNIPKSSGSVMRKSMVRNLTSQLILGYDRYVTAIEGGEERLRKQDRQTKFLHEKLSQYRAPLLQLQIQYNQNKGKVYTEEEDRFLLVHLDKFGVGREDLYERIREEIRESPLFRFDWFFLSRTSLEIQRRCTTLLTMIMREFGEEKRGLEDDDSRESTPATKKIKKAGNKVVESLKVNSPSQVWLLMDRSSRVLV